MNPEKELLWPMGLGPEHGVVGFRVSGLGFRV